mgnify:CR=1 FL=1
MQHSAQRQPLALRPVTGEPFRKLSIFFPMWNEAAYIERAVGYAKEECELLIGKGEILDYELIVVDDASTDDTPSPNHSGLYRNPLPMADGLLVAVHTSETRADRNDGTRAQPQSRYRFRMKTITQAGQYWAPSQALTGAGIVETIGGGVAGLSPGDRVAVSPSRPCGARWVNEVPWAAAKPASAPI